MKPIRIVALVAIAFGAFSTGCARFATTQTDTSYDKGQPTRTITTRATAHTLFSAKSALANFKATQTDKSQGASVGGLTQETSGSNAVALVEKIVGAAVGGAVKAAAP